MVARHVGPLGRASHWLVSLQCLLSFALIVVLNSWWFLKMAQGLRRLLFQDKGKGPPGPAPATGGSAPRRRKSKAKEEGEGDDGSASSVSRKGRARRQGKAA